MSDLQLVLASSSPRRRELLARLGIHPSIEPADIDETPRPDDTPAAYVSRLAAEKAATALRPGVVVLAADTAVVLDGEILGKPTDPEDAAAMLRRMRARQHSAVTGVAVARVGDNDSEPVVEVATEWSSVAVEAVSDERVEWYAHSGEPDDKAGGYGLQGAGGLFADRIEGSVTNIIGLPLPVVSDLFARHDLDLLDFSNADPTQPSRSIIERTTRHVLDPPQRDDPVVRLASPDRIAELLDESVGLALIDAEPAHPDEAVAAALDTVFDYSVQTTHPRFINQNFAGAHPVAVAGDFAAAALNTAASTYEIAPVFTLLERAVIDKLARLAGFPTGDAPAGIMVPGGSSATLHALQMARHRLDPDSITRGISGEPTPIFVAAGAHYSTAKMAALLGIGSDHVVTVESESDASMRPAALAAALDAATARGHRPLAVVATSGTTITAAFDPLDEIADVCADRGVWLHVDGCYGASALFSSTHRERMEGVERADSLVWNLHKMMGMTQQCTVLLVQEPERLAATFATGADYLFQPDKLHADLDAGDRTIHCGRRIDALKLWLSWKHLGDIGFAERVDHSVALADHARNRIADSDGRFAAIVAGSFTNVCFTWVPPELRPLDLGTISDDDRARLHALQPAIKAQMQQQGTALVGYQSVNGINCFRLIFMNPLVTTDDVDELLRIIEEYGTAAWTPA